MESYILTEYLRYIDCFKLDRTVIDNEVYMEDEDNLIVMSDESNSLNEIRKFRIYYKGKIVEQTDFIKHKKEYLNRYPEKNNNIVIKHDKISGNYLTKNIYLMKNNRLLRGKERTYYIDDSSLDLEEAIQKTFKSKKHYINNELLEKGRVYIKGKC